jgi:hypothetical protein
MARFANPVGKKSSAMLCQRATLRGYRLRCVRKLIEHKSDDRQVQTTMPLIEEHPIIRPLDENGQWIGDALSQSSVWLNVSAGGTIATRLRSHVVLLSSAQSDDPSNLRSHSAS